MEGENLKMKFITVYSSKQKSEVGGGRTSVLTDSCNVGRISSTLWIRSRSAIPTDCAQGTKAVKESAVRLSRSEVHPYRKKMRQPEQ